MELTAHGVWTMVHGMGFGALYLLACSGAMVELWRHTSSSRGAPDRTADDTFLRVCLATMAVLAPWPTAISAVSAPYTTFGLLVEQRVGSATLFANGENLTNVRQTRFDPLLLPAQDPTGRWTTPEWAPLEGRMLNAGVRVHF